MNCLTAFCISHIQESPFYEDMACDALFLDKNDFLPNGYLVDLTRYPLVGLRQVGQRRLQKADDDDFINDGDEEAPEDIEPDEDVEQEECDGMAALAPVDFRDPTSDMITCTPSETLNFGSEAGTISPSPRVLFPGDNDVDFEILDRPSSAPISRASSS